jgi:ribonuclease HI
MIYINSDGGSRGNPGPGAVGVIIRKDEEILIKYGAFIGQQVTNNIAEYEALIRGLELASKVTDKDVTCFLDSELIVKQLLGEYKVRNHALIELFLKVQKSQEKFKTVIYKHTIRWDKFQQMADKILNEELDKRGFRRYYKRNN